MALADLGVGSARASRGASRRCRVSGEGSSGAARPAASEQYRRKRLLKGACDGAARASSRANGRARRSSPELARSACVGGRACCVQELRLTAARAGAPAGVESYVDWIWGRTEACSKRSMER
ncbi:hypothetical protein GQ55_9G355000 [Panicum hallii var. hallii]|uniref:Uncharacterized protein n=1 Tax=Panicum hallii var. hallii TaxID=1504633 RepID=A0A2T7C8N3_9POAL|nr:hypothetical protein GQ55_9G355000 [Panicum hallii var. hallii]